jgi:hypothetical protein
MNVTNKVTVLYPHIDTGQLSTSELIDTSALEDQILVVVITDQRKTLETTPKPHL